ncbi:MAG: TVP38/TMEM64 family protein [Nitrospirae bacterium]|nr:TVP38/TMEM64 family protein [Nitrospirota bacterium]
MASLFAAVIVGFFYFDVDRYVMLDALKVNRDHLLAYAQAHYLSAVILFIFLYCLQTTFSLPGAALFTLAGGFLFGSLAGMLYANLGATSGATLAFLAARYLLHDWVEARFGQRLVFVQEGFSKNAFHYLLTLRLIPIFPFFLINLVSGLTRISLGRFVAATAIGIIPGDFVYAYAGRQLGTINSLHEIASPGVLGAFTLLGLLAFVSAIYQKFRKRSVADSYSSMK